VFQVPSLSSPLSSFCLYLFSLSLSNTPPHLIPTPPTKEVVKLS
jgi:hypothetical protein